ncbi:hypothetical protein D3M95_04830 [Corynebacterium falsenii]|uniref:Uncharacterized protein n=1 Tax=Corynebacterium falsenii TaxID=108486 RepID=A0A418Q7A8_9CORY|nr:hypothetical protein [Corynebacterium falsenii]RIX35197.1 hypothetical protein D3M95_04830 [Corynebacterium falsenii]
MTTTDKTPSLGNNGADALGTNRLHDTNPQTTTRYEELTLVRALLHTRCGDAVTLCVRQDIRALYSEHRRLVLRELLDYAAEQVRAGHPEAHVDPAAVMARVQAAGGGTAAMQELIDALTGPIDGMQARTADVCAIPVLWKVVNEECLLREVKTLSDALHADWERRDVPALLRNLDGHAPRVIEHAKRAGLLLDNSRADGREVR